MPFNQVVNDILGQIADTLTFSGGQSPALPGIPNIAGEQLYPLKIGEYEFKEECLIQVKGSKELVLTKIPGGNGTVKELTSREDYEINIAGRLVHKTNSEMLDELKDLIGLYNTEESLRVICPYTDSFGIKEVVIKNFDPIIKRGYQSVLWFTLNCLSDNAVNRSKIIKNQKKNICAN